MQQLTEQEKKRIQRYCTYPKIATTALVMSFVACLLMLPLQMINDIAFHQKEFQPAGIYTAIALTAIELVIFCYCALAPRFGMQGKQWKELQSRLAIAQTNKDRSAEGAGMLAAQDALEPVCKRVAADDPYESYHDYGYRIIGYLRDNDLGAQAAYVYLSFDADGMLTDVDYTSQIDPEASLAYNLACSEQDIATLCAPLNGLGISVATPGLLTPCSLSDEFKQAFLAGSLYEEISIKTEDESIKSYYTFDTEPKEEFDKYTHPEISLMLSAKED